MQLDHGNVLFTSALLGLHQSCSVVDAHDEAASDLWIEGTRVTSLVHLEDLLDPGDNLMGGWVGWLVKVDDTVVFVHINWTSCWGISAWQRGEVARLDVELVEVL